MAGVDKGRILDWKNGSGLDEHYRKWMKKVEVSFKGPLATANNAVKCNYIIYWSGEEGMDFVDKCETSGKLPVAKRHMQHQCKSKLTDVLVDIYTFFNILTQ